MTTPFLKAVEALIDGKKIRHRDWMPGMYASFTLPSGHVVTPAGVIFPKADGSYGLDEFTIIHDQARQDAWEIIEEVPAEDG